MKIGLIDVDGTKFPNLALGKIAAYHRSLGDIVEWVEPLYWDYDRVYQSKVFAFTPDTRRIFPCEVVKGGTGYDIHSAPPPEIDRLQPDYSIFPNVDHHTAYGFLTRGCPNKCPWCCVPRKEGNIRPYMDVDEIAVDSRNKLILMDNNILACDYGLQQIEKIITRGYRVDFNQALDARLITDEIARMLAKVRWLTHIRLGCDTPRQIVDCERAMKMIDSYSKIPKSYLMYAMINSDLQESYERLMHFRNNKRVRVVAQPFRDLDNPRQVIPQWQRDMARWAMRREFWTQFDFKQFHPRKNFTCNKYFAK